MIENLFGGGGGGGGTVDTITAGTGISVNSTDPANPIITNTSLNTDEVAKVSSNDTTAGYLNGKLVAGTGISLTENNNGGNETLTIASTVTPGVTGFTGSQNTASPNNTVNASRLLVDAASTNADIVLQPKGTGAIVAQLPDGTATGGNKRGTNAVDLQTSRTVNTQVASGTESVVIGGQRNTASNSNSVVVGGLVNTASGVQSTVLGGSSSTASGAASLATGRSATASGDSSFAGGGNSGNGSTASGQNSFAWGVANTSSGQYALTFGIENQCTADGFAIGNGARSTQAGQYCHARGYFAAIGDAQYERYILRRQTTNNTPTELSCDGTAPAATTRIAIANDSTYVFHAFVVARRTDADNESAGYEIKGVIDNNAGTTAFVGTPTTTVLAEDTAAWDVSVTADNTNDALVFTVTGEAAKTIRWVATVNLTKVTG